MLSNVPIKSNPGLPLALLSLELHTFPYGCGHRSVLFVFYIVYSVTLVQAGLTYPCITYPYLGFIFKPILYTGSFKLSFVLFFLFFFYSFYIL